MQGNVAEWVDACDANTGADDTCYLVGGSFVQIGATDYCDEIPADYPRNTTANPFGFRCCSGG